MRERWQLLQQLRLEKKYAALGIPLPANWAEGGIAVGPDGEPLARGGGNGAFSGIPSTALASLVVPPAGLVTGLAWGQTLTAPRLFLKKGHKKGGRGGLAFGAAGKPGPRKRGRPPKNLQIVQVTIFPLAPLLFSLPHIHPWYDRVQSYSLSRAGGGANRRGTGGGSGWWR